MNRIKSIRTFYRLSQAKFGELFHVDQTAVSNWERGKNDIDIKTLEQIADYFKLPIEYIIGKEFDLKYPQSQWREDNWEDFYSASEDSRELLKFKIGKGYFIPEAELPTSEEPQLSDSEVALLELFRSVSSEDQELVFRMIRGALNNQQ